MIDETLIYYVRCTNGPNFAIQANSKEEFNVLLNECKREYPEAHISRIEVMTPAEYKRLIH